MSLFFIPFVNLLFTILNLYIWVVISSIIYSWLVNFSVINMSNHFVVVIGDFLFRATDPVLDPIRRCLPELGGLDLSPLVLILLIHFFQEILKAVMVSL